MLTNSNAHPPSPPCVVAAPALVARAFRPPPPSTRPPRAGAGGYDSADISLVGASEDHFSPSELPQLGGWVGALRAYAVEVASLFEPNGVATSVHASATATEARLCELFPPDRSAEGRAVAAGLGALYTVLRGHAMRLPSVRTPPSKLAPSGALHSASSALAASAAVAAQSLTEPPPLGLGSSTAAAAAAMDDARPSSFYGRSYSAARSPSPPLLRRAAPLAPGGPGASVPPPWLNLSTATSFGSLPVDAVDASSPPPVAPLDGHQPPVRRPVRWSTSCHDSAAPATLGTPGATARGGALSGCIGRESRAGSGVSAAPLPLPPQRGSRASAPAPAATATIDTSEALPVQERRAESREPRERFLRGVRPLETWMLSLKRVPSPPQGASHKSAGATGEAPRRIVPSVSGVVAAQAESATGTSGSGGVCCFGDGGIPSRSSVEREQRRQCYRSSSCHTVCASAAATSRPHQQQHQHQQHQQQQHHHGGSQQMQYSRHRSGLPTGASAAAAAVATAAGPPAGFASLDSMSLRASLQRAHVSPAGPPATRHTHRTQADCGGASGADYVGVGSGMVGALGIAGRTDRAAAVRSGSTTSRTRPSSPCPLYGPLSQDKWSRQVAQLRHDQSTRNRTEHL